MVSISPALAAGLPQTPSLRWCVDHQKEPQAGRRSLAAGCPPLLPPPRPSEVAGVPKRRTWTRSAYPGSMAPGEGAASLSALSGQPQVSASQRLRYAVLFAVRLCGRTRIRPQWVRQPGWWSRGA